MVSHGLSLYHSFLRAAPEDVAVVSASQRAFAPGWLDLAVLTLVTVLQRSQTLEQLQIIQIKDSALALETMVQMDFPLNRENFRRCLFWGGWD